MKCPLYFWVVGGQRDNQIGTLKMVSFLPASLFTPDCPLNHFFSKVSKGTKRSRGKKGKASSKRTKITTKTPETPPPQAAESNANPTSTSPIKNRVINGAMHTTQAERFSIGQKVVWNPEDKGETYPVRVSGFTRNKNGFFTGEYTVQIQLFGESVHQGMTAHHRDLFVPAKQGDNEVDDEDDTEDVGAADDADESDRGVGSQGKGSEEDESEDVSDSS